MANKLEDYPELKEMIRAILFTGAKFPYNSGNHVIDKNQFIHDGILDMDQVLNKFMVHWNELYQFTDEKFIEENGRKFFLLYLKPIINGTGNYYIESQTRDHGRTDIIVDYNGEGE